MNRCLRFFNNNQFLHKYNNYYLKYNIKSKIKKMSTSELISSLSIEEIAIINEKKVIQLINYIYFHAYK